MKADQLLGRRVVALNGRSVGRIEEFLLRRNGGGWIVWGFALGPAGLMERLGLHARALVGLRRAGYVVNWDQLTLSETGPLKLTCPVGEIQSRG